MRCAGIDIGSRSIELVILEGNEITWVAQRDTGFDPMSEAKALIEDACFDTIMATGYGRNLFELSFDAPTVTEIKAHAAGIRHLFPEAVTILDIGGQDSKVIRVNPKGRVVKFEMNDRCAAGTGKFLEIMAKSLGFEIERFGASALEAKKALTINAMCAVFAESEVTSLMAKGENRKEIARGIHLSVAKRAASMVKRLATGGDLVFTGGVANNICIARFIEEITGRTTITPDNPQMTGALGAAILAQNL